MIYGLLANFVVLLHLAFILFALFGGLFVLKRRWMLWVHMPAAIWAAVVVIQGWICPLTPLENWLRRASDGVGYEGGFIEQYIIPLIYPANLTTDLQLVLGLLAVLANILVYVFVFYRLRRD